MIRRLHIILFLLLPFHLLAEPLRTAVVVDSVSGETLPNASVFDRNGNIIGICGHNGRMPYVSAADYPITVRYLGFHEKSVPTANVDTIFMRENMTELREVVVESKNHKVLHTLAYIREYSTLTTYSDTVFLFREKMVDFMTAPPKSGFKGWSSPRILKSESYYRFSDTFGLDSVSDRCGYHFSWTDWIGIVSPERIIPGLRNVVPGTDTVHGKFSPAEIWNKNEDRVSVVVDVLADTTSRKWVPNLATFFIGDVDFDSFKIKFNYGNVVNDSISIVDLTGYSYNIETKGRGHGMFMFNRRDQSFYVNTYAEIYIVDKEYITVKEARKWAKLEAYKSDISFFVPPEAPELQESVLALVERVQNVDHDATRSNLGVDKRLAGKHFVNQNFGQRALQLLKTLTGISKIRSDIHRKKQWRSFRKEQALRNKHYYKEHPQEE